MVWDEWKVAAGSKCTNSSFCNKNVLDWVTNLLKTKTSTCWIVWGQIVYSVVIQKRESRIRVPVNDHNGKIWRWSLWDEGVKQDIFVISWANYNFVRTWLSWKELKEESKNFSWSKHSDSVYHPRWRIWQISCRRRGKLYQIHQITGRREKSIRTYKAAGCPLLPPPPPPPPPPLHWVKKLLFSGLNWILSFTYLSSWWMGAGWVVGWLII